MPFWGSFLPHFCFAPLLLCSTFALQIRHTTTCRAMDERTRRRQRWKKSLSISNWIGKGDSDDDSDDGVKVSMHGRLMVQPSKRILKDMSLGSTGAGRMTAIEEDDEDEKRRAETQYRLTTVKRRKVSSIARLNQFTGATRMAQSDD